MYSNSLKTALHHFLCAHTGSRGDVPHLWEPWTPGLLLVSRLTLSGARPAGSRIPEASRQKPGSLFYRR